MLRIVKPSSRSLHGAFDSMRSVVVESVGNIARVSAVLELFDLCNLVGL